MGIKGGWALAKPSGTSTLTELALAEFISNKSRFRGLRLAIDASMVLISADEAVKKINHPSIDSLKLLHQFCLELQAIPAVLGLFVFDGPQRPKTKRGRIMYAMYLPSMSFHTDHIRGCSHVGEFKLEHRLKKLCEGFGFEYFLAAGEAEFEIANLERAGYVDACFTGDSDIFLTDPDLIIRLPSILPCFAPAISFPPRSLTNMPVNFYRTSRLAAPSRRHRPLTQIDYRCLAILLGGDYDLGLLPPPPPSGVPYKGPSVSYGQQAIKLCQSAYPAALDLSYSGALDLARRILDKEKRESALRHWGMTGKLNVIPSSQLD